ncbi:hypothetical protein AB434_2586 [Heyndrickxia coagulans]|uniref:Uncharacterized protein n=1 Tax=Heyndrickxia coagulans TaxID=1398 RepID=A0AAN0T7X7_HEYCO|nr:hypothetical protein SB48_HM08orf04325 [Heyndrickxia coagulans]AKN54991.1 hypothetical protein AB434_2586 [Heyndrickxia coagulans]KYC61617.1 hypothetical protein B4100_0118 [Heyndrickxia coagulans]KYC90406.1 hypothetical protein B4096_0070 [Heyndrickxia coagulans]
MEKKIPDKWCATVYTYFFHSSNCLLYNDNINRFYVRIAAMLLRHSI